MPLTKRALELPGDPAAAALARAWVCDVLEEIDRGELRFAAELGVSELVTNALLHGAPPVVVRMRGTNEHPRIEVVDHSPEPLRPTRLTAISEPGFPATFGRGLSIVAMNALQWGSERSADGRGKTVWFEPSAQPQEREDLLAIFRSFEEETDPQVPNPPPDGVTIRLLNLPVDLFGQLRLFHYELRRELRLLALGDPERYPLAVAVTEVFRQIDAERRNVAGVVQLDRAIRGRLDHIDLEYVVPPQAPRTMERALDLCVELYRVFADESLIELAPSPQLRVLQHWYLSEFARQGRGEAPHPWSESLLLEAVVR